ncbi:alpha/beta fold hydrolase [Paraburkholderia gardini]|uniref:alpha/beta fold hydrolase n=1 Tax=Paraburkholderia gardini TaxID=2823469 RepID=UPI001D64A988|nr:alpha/beta hydrolase [Paraburkholderia gardini]CAG4897089.1 Haloalkane dehalogenase [Paraburkholderia gardini]
MAPTIPPLPQFAEHRVKRDSGHVYVRDFAGTGPAFVVLHGFPDDSHIYDLLIPRLASAGRRVVAVDFLGFGGSDKPVGAQYSFPQQLADLEAVVEVLKLEQIIPVGHDAGGPAAINFSLKHPDRTSATVVMNAFYGDAPGLRVPELIELFSNRELRKLAMHFLQSPQQFAWLIDFQRNLLQHGLTDEQKVSYFEFLGPVIDNNFRQQPSAAMAFAQMTSQLHEEVAANTARIVDFRRSEVPVHLIWGNADPYLHLSVAQHIQSQGKNVSLHVLDAGHWPQIDAADEVAQIMLGVR